MRKRVAIIVILLSMFSVFILNHGQSMEYYGQNTQNDKEFEWHTCNEENFV